MNFKRILLLKLYELLDIAALFACHFSALFLANPTFIATKKNVLLQSVRMSELIPAIITLEIWHVVLFTFGLYRSKRLQKFWQVNLEVVQAILFCAAIGSVLFTIFRWPHLSWKYLGLFVVLSSASLIVIRASVRIGLRYARLRGRNIRHILVIGTNIRALKFAKRIASNPNLGYRLIGFVDDDWHGAAKADKMGYPLIGNLDLVFQYLRDNVVDEVFIGLPLNSYYSWVADFARYCEKHGIIIRVSSDIFHMSIARSDVDILEGMPMISHYTGAIRDWQKIIKRWIDFAVSTLVLVVASPLMLIIGIAVRLTTPGPALFRQSRVGLNKRRFTIYKFRTMHTDAEDRLQSLESKNEADGPAFKIKNDPRVTRVGHFLRKTSLDELPQFVNVFLGSMSLVGPRPLPLRDYAGFTQDWHRRRLSVKPGITCLWQISGRNETTFNEWMHLDLAYIDTWSLKLDLKILLKTVWVMFRGTGM